MTDSAYSHGDARGANPGRARVAQSPGAGGNIRNMNSGAAVGRAPGMGAPANQQRRAPNAGNVSADQQRRAPNNGNASAAPGRRNGPQTAHPGAAVNGASAKASAAKKADKKSKAKDKRFGIDFITTISETRYSFPVAVVLIAIGFAFLIGMIVTSSVKINDITSDISGLKRTYASSVTQENELRRLLETRDDLREVETRAKEDYGMVKTDQVERYYLTTKNSERIELIEEETVEKSDRFGGLGEFFGSVLDRIARIFGFDDD